jgi:hypothetical protein
MPWSTGCRAWFGRPGLAAAMVLLLPVSTLGTWSIGASAAAGATAPPATMAFHVFAPATATAGARIDVTITATDPHGNLATRYSGAKTLTFSGPADSPDAAAPSYPTSVTFIGGVGDASVALPDVQTTALSATQGEITGTSGPITVSQGAAAILRASIPPNPTAGVVTTLTVAATDAYGNPATHSDGTLQFASTAANAVLPDGGNLTAGTGTFSVALDSAGPQTITVTDATEPTLTASFKSTLTATTPAVMVRSAPAATFHLYAPGKAAAGTPTQFTVIALDVFGNVATGYTGAVHLTSSDPSAVLPAEGTLTRGTGTFPITFASAGPLVIVATDPTNSLITTAATISVGAPAATAFHLTPPATATAGDVFNLTITARDAHGTTTGFAGAVRFASSDPAAVLPSSSRLTRGAGTFPIVFETAGPQTITVTGTAGRAVTGTTQTITVSPAAAATFQASAPATAAPGTPTTVTVIAIDAFGNIATGYTGPVELTSSDPAAVLPSEGTLTHGTGTVPVTFKTAGEQDISASDPTDSLLTSAASVFVGRPPAAL